MCFMIDASGSIKDNNPPDGSYDNCELLLEFLRNVTNRHLLHFNIFKGKYNMANHIPCLTICDIKMSIYVFSDCQ